MPTIATGITQLSYKLNPKAIIIAKMAKQHSPSMLDPKSLMSSTSDENTVTMLPGL